MRLHARPDPTQHRRRRRHPQQPTPTQHASYGVPPIRVGTGTPHCPFLLSLLSTTAAAGAPAVRAHGAPCVAASVRWCGVVWCGVVWCGVVWCGVVHNSGVVRWNGMEWNGLEWIGIDWNGLEWIGMDWNGMGWDVM